MQRRKHPRRARSPALQFAADGQQNRERYPPPGGGTMQASSPTEGAVIGAAVPADGLPRFVGRAFTPAADLAESGCCRVGRRFLCVGADACIGPRGLRRRKHPRRARSPALQFMANGQRNRERHPLPGRRDDAGIAPDGGRDNWRRRSGRWFAAVCRAGVHARRQPCEKRAPPGYFSSRTRAVLRVRQARNSKASAQTANWISTSAINSTSISLLAGIRPGARASAWGCRRSR